MSGKPLLFLDVDGVLNPFGYDAAPDGFVAHELFPNEESVLVRADHGRWIDELRERFDVVWATAWNDDANELLAPLLGIEALPIAAMPPTPFPPEAKVAVVARYAGARPLAWIDDAHTATGETWAAGRTEPTLLVQCDPSIGLTRSQIVELMNWGGRSSL